MNKICENCRLKESCAWEEWNDNNEAECNSCFNYFPNLKTNKELNKEKNKS